jgi:penicillin-binding protein 1C
MNERSSRTVYLRVASSSAAKRFFVTVVLAIVLGTATFVTRPIRPHDLPRDARALTFVDRSGLPLGTILGRDDRHTIAVPLSDMSPAFLAALCATEDRRFARHGAFDPIGALRVFAASLRERGTPHGASTLSMQLARQLVPIAPNAWGKLEEIVVAMRLENGLSKRQILEAYANRAPMGSNVYGVEAAARTYFGIDAAHLDLAQAAFLAGLPNDPVRLDPYAHPAAARGRQRVVLARLVATGAIAPSDAALAASEHLALQSPSSGILAAPQALFSLAPLVAADRDRVRTTIDRPLQQFVEAQVRDVIARLAGHDASQAAAIVVDNHTGDVLAYVGSRDYFDDADGGRNDGVRALRQPGSTLKPFLYELALERRVVRPTTILADVPVAYALPGAHLYAPTDYSERFSGPVRVRLALANSLNVPAVRVLSNVGVDTFLERLHALGFTHLTKPPSYYGLGLTLGGGEVSLYELARAYATLARDGAPTALRLTRDGATQPDPNVGASAGDPAWPFVTNVLADPIARSASFGLGSILSVPFDAAVKTGTSSDFRDTWTAGFTRDYTVAVWVGNFDGRPMRDISGITGAGPLWNRIVLHLHANSEPQPFDLPPGYAPRTICATTGLRPTPACPAVVRELLDARDRTELARETPRAPTLDATYDAWLVTSPERDRMPTRILFPRDGDRFVAAPGRSLKIEIAGARSPEVTIDGRPLARTDDDYLVPLRVGTHTITARSASGDSTVHVSIVPPPQRAPNGFTFVTR